jgi:hypothetical protein
MKPTVPIKNDFLIFKSDNIVKHNIVLKKIISGSRLVEFPKNKQMKQQ